MSSRQKVVVLGAGGHGQVILDALLAADTCEVVGVLDDDPAKLGQRLLGLPVLGPSAEMPALARRWNFRAVALAIGDNYLRDAKFRMVCDAHLEPLTVIHPAAHISRFVELGRGVVVLAGAVVNPGSVLEDNVCINTAASVDHDNRLERSCHVFPGATLTGGVHVGAYSYIGSGAVVNPCLRIARYSFVGAGAVVVRDVAEGVVVAGVPAREISAQPRRPDMPNPLPRQAAGKESVA